MEKKPIEKFIEEHGLVLEIDARCNCVYTMLYKDDDSDLYIRSYCAPTLNESIDLAVQAYLKKMGKK